MKQLAAALLRARLAGGCAALLVPATAFAQTVAAELVADGFDSPVFAGAPLGDTSRLFVIEQRVGKIRIVDLASGVVLLQPFLDIGERIASLPHQGLLGLAFHPDYQTNGRFFIDYIDLAGTTQIVEYSVSADPDIANASPVQTIFRLEQPSELHNGGCIRFGVDGMLYASTGDGGPPRTVMAPLENSGGRAQDLDDSLGKLLRFDVDLPAPFIPPTNPFVGAPGNDEIWAFGLRNPWRFSFDRLTGDLYLGDVGEAGWEEIDFQPASSTGGENYGWRCREGAHDVGGISCPLSSAMVNPLHEYSHSGSVASVIGGYVYRGDAIPGLQGTYFFGDFNLDTVSSFRNVGGTVTELIDRTAELAASGVVIDQLASFGQDATGELYIVCRPGQVFRLIKDCNAAAQVYCVTSPNGSGPGAVLTSSGSLELTSNDFHLQITGGRPNDFGIIFYGFAPAQRSQGNGVLCIDSSSGIWRLFPIVQLDSHGNGSYRVDFQVPPMSSGPGQVLPGATHYFQFWYRDPGGPGPTDHNYSDGVMVTFCP